MVVLVVLLEKQDLSEVDCGLLDQYEFLPLWVVQEDIGSFGRKILVELPPPMVADKN